MDKIRLAVIGAGEMGMLRSVIAKALQEYELVAIVEKSRTIARIAGKRLDVNYYTGFLGDYDRKSNFNRLSWCY
jgi:predicted dehydrogenase